MCHSRGVRRDNDSEFTSEDNSDNTSSAATHVKEPMDKVLIARLVSAAVILGLFVVFALQNTESVEIDFLAWSFNLSKFLMVLLSAIIGVVVWTLAGAYSNRAKKKRS